MKKIFKTCCFGFLILGLSFVIIAGILMSIYSIQKIKLKSKCELPCWHEITVGETQEDDAIKVISNLPKVDYKLSTNINHRFYGQIDVVNFGAYPWFNQFSTIDGSIYFKENETVYMWLGGGLGKNVGQVIEKYGEPEYVYVKPIKGFIVATHLFYPQEGLIFIAQKGFNYDRIESKTRVTGVMILKPGDFQAYVDEGTDYPYNSPSGSIFVPWSGYGELKGKYWFPGGQDKY